MKTFHFLTKTLQSNKRATLLYVLQSKGSSPGRKGFSMAVDEDGNFVGTIGGGIMEVKLLELAKDKIKKGDFRNLIKQQFHNKQNPKNQSGLICSGEQTVAIIPFEDKDLLIVQTIIEKATAGIRINVYEKELRLANEDQPTPLATLEINQNKRIHILGGGHVGLALSQVMSLLDYQVLVYDNRDNLSTIQQNTAATSTKIIDFNDTLEAMTYSPLDTVVIVSTSYRTDKIILKQLYKEKFRYIGMMGSDHKIKQLFDELQKEGISDTELAHIHAPIGIPIYSKTTMEIAVSIAGQIILETNRGLPTGRSY